MPVMQVEKREPSLTYRERISGSIPCLTGIFFPALSILPFLHECICTVPRSNIIASLFHLKWIRL